MKSNKEIARLAGMFYLALIVFGLFTQFFARSNFIVEGDPLATTRAISENMELFRFGLISDLISHSLYFLLALTLYKLLKPVNKTLSMLFLLMVSINVAILSINMFNHLAVMLIISDPSQLITFGSAQLSQAVMFLLKMHSYGYVIAQLYFAGWLIPLGYLLKKSGLFPKIWGWLIMLAGFFYGLDFFVTFLAPDLAIITETLTGVAFGLEFLFCIWLLLKGARNTH